MKLLFTLLILTAPAAQAAAPAAGCAAPAGSYEAARDRVRQAYNQLEAGMKKLQCNLASCDPGHDKKNNCYVPSDYRAVKGHRTVTENIAEAAKRRESLETILLRYERAVAPLGKDELPNIDQNTACSTTGVPAMQARLAPVDSTHQSLVQEKFGTEIEKKFKKMKNDYADELANLQDRTIMFVRVACNEASRDGYKEMFKGLEALHNSYPTLEAYFKGRSCQLAQAVHQFEAFKSNCSSLTPAQTARPAAPPADQVRGTEDPNRTRGIVTGSAPTDTATQSATSTGTGTGSGRRVPERLTQTTGSGATGMFDDFAATQTAARVDPPVDRAIREPASVQHEAPAEIKNPDNWGTMSRDQWNKNDQYKQSINAPMPRLSAQDNQEVNQFLSQARSGGQSDYALRVQAALNATAMDMNGESVGTAPSVYQDGVVGSRTRGAIDYYMSDPTRKALFLQHLRSYGITSIR